MTLNYKELKEQFRKRDKELQSKERTNRVNKILAKRRNK